MGKKILRNIYEPSQFRRLGIYENRPNEDLYDLYEKPNILTYIIYNRLEWLGHNMCRADGDILKNVLIEKINKKTSNWKNKMERHRRK